MKISKPQTGAVDPLGCQRSTLAAGHRVGDNIDMASQHNENLLMPCAAVMMKLTECAKLLFVLFRLLTCVNVPLRREGFI